MFTDALQIILNGKCNKVLGVIELTIDYSLFTIHYFTFTISPDIPQVA